MNRAYEEVIEWLSGGFTPADLVAYRPSETVQQRVAELIRQEKTEGLPAPETAELGHYLQLEHLLRLAKARARHRLAA
ncbi:hypothetical protein KLP40_10020 [Hymenobacter sp. NST-14]|uniref:hypothetical protein n=1 Tax=Hymenobacter piscis TaxID=2839984 RepID=UPI001C03389E|nr:hypothetical protein [Hymenobacter piscis]MBT9393497.1 hypothetical protein [Hymenobacter piscis]